MDEKSTPSEFSSQQSSSIPPTNAIASKPHRLRWLFVVLGGLIIIVLICVAIVVISGLRLFQNSQSAATDAIKVVDQFLQAGARKDASAGFLLFSPTVRDQQVTQDGIAKLFTAHEEYFANYTKVKQDSFNVMSGTTGVTASLEGIISYNGRPDRKFAATLVKENDQWKLIGIRLLEEVGK